MSRLISRQLTFLRFFEKAPALQQQLLARHLTAEQANVVTEIAYNLLSGTVTLAPEDKRRLKRHAKAIRIIGNAKYGLKKRKRAMTRTIVHALISRALPVIERALPQRP